ncbi:hypothetical protein EYF80_013023 [Liparis tanakae]|uniref:Uncharacterized protein n=1 Tax=Liparis tanakae TaxID=230148 RepID=A0A4Z2IH49_9TELE|nr:hypothetical protein EYF80_013023 [Liparis tanakae]
MRNTRGAATCKLLVKWIIPHGHHHWTPRWGRCTGHCDWLVLHQHIVFTLSSPTSHLARNTDACPLWVPVACNKPSQGYLDVGENRTNEMWLAVTQPGSTVTLLLRSGRWLLDQQSCIQIKPFALCPVKVREDEKVQELSRPHRSNSKEQLTETSDGELGYPLSQAKAGEP